MDCEDEWYVLCSDKNVLLEHLDDTNRFRITFDVSGNYNSILEIISENQLFELLFELNKDILLDYTTTETNNIHNVLLKVSTKNINITNIKDDMFMHLNYTSKFNSNECELNSVVIDKVDKLTKNHLFLSDFNVKISNNNSYTKFVINYVIDDMIDNNLAPKFVALYLKKLFYRVKLYFD